MHLDSAANSLYNLGELYDLSEPQSLLLLHGDKNI